MRWPTFFALLAAAATAAGPQTQRDLRLEKEELPAAKEAPAATPSIPRGYALVVGVAKYKHLPANFQLHYAERDAEAMYSILISPEGGNFPPENVHKLIGPDATLAALRRELETWLPSVAREPDRVVIYFAGHGFVFGGKPYLAPADFRADNVAGTGYPMETLGEVIGSKIKAKWKVLLTDSCHSGAITPEDNQQINRSLLDLSSSVFSLTASRDREQSFESPDWGGGHGIFTYYVVRGLEGSADENRDGIVTADELAEYVRRNVREATGGRQNPTSDRGSFDPNMLLAYVPSSAAAGAPPPPKDGTLIIEVNMNGVEIFLDGRSVGIADKGTALRLPGLVPGIHTLKAVKMGYEPDGPREEMVYPGQERTVTVRIMIPRRRNKAAVDLFDEAVEAYNKGNAANYRKAAGLLTHALAIDPEYSQAALYLARVQNALFEDREAEKYFRRAIEIDPDYLEARASFAGMLLDRGNADEAIRQLTAVVQRDRNHAMAFYLLAQAFRMKEAYPQSIEAARTSVRLQPGTAEAHFWLAESLRLNGNYDQSRKEYLEYLRLSDFDSKLAGKLNYYALGFLIGQGKKKRASQTDIWKDLRSLAYFGLCDAERKLNNFDAAIGYCQKSLSYDPNDPYVHYALGLCFMRKAQAANSVAALPAACSHFRTMLGLNPDLTESDYARKNLDNIRKLIACP
ncbi:MAG: tetratricopeptide repeat protein [Rhodospirillales bacterium]